jgi:uncharacterized HhH-GPD family protein
VVLYLSGDTTADTLLGSNPFALLMGMVLDQQVPLERAFSAPNQLTERIGPIDAKRIAAMDLEELTAAFSEKPALHRFPAAMAERTQKAAQIIVDRYDGDTAKLWEDAPDGKTLLANLRALPGFGEQKAKIFLALLGKQLAIEPPGWREASAPYGEKGSFFSVADIDGPEALLRVREHKRDMKAAAKSVAQLDTTGARPRAARR